MTDGESKDGNITSTGCESSEIYAETQNNHNDETSTAVGEGTRELSQTDHLNKRLLDSFLQRLNSSQPDANLSSANETADDFDDGKPKTN